MDFANSKKLGVYMLAAGVAAAFVGALFFLDILFGGYSRKVLSDG